MSKAILPDASEKNGNCQSVNSVMIYITREKLIFRKHWGIDYAWKHETSTPLRTHHSSSQLTGIQKKSNIFVFSFEYKKLILIQWYKKLHFYWCPNTFKSKFKVPD